VTGPRETMFAAIAAKLLDVRIENGYQTDVDAVYRLDVVPDEMPSSVRRALLVLESLTPESWQFLDHGPSGGQYCTSVITIAGVVRQGTTDLKSSERHTELNQLIESAAKALMLDPTFGGSVKESKLNSPVGFVDTDKGEALFNMSLHVIYAFNWSDL
jgi:hypothetical protein